MADEAPAAPAEEVVEGEPKKKGPLVKIILIVVAVLLLIGLSVGGTLLATGFFNKKPKEAVDAQLDKLEGHGDGHAPAGDGHGAPAADAHAAPAADAHGKPAVDSHGKPVAEPEGKELASPEGEAERWKFNYYAFEKPLLSNVAGSRKVMQVTLSIMTHYDDRVIKNLKTHELALRAGILDVMRQKTDADLLRPDFRKALAEDLRLVINSLLEKYEGFGGIEEVMFTEFVVQ
jgi:flagellar FliL protein